MNRHLSADEFSALLAGEDFSRGQSAWAAGHAAECKECRAEVARMESALTDLRAAAQGVTASPPRLSRPAKAPTRRWFTAPRLALGGAFAAAIIMIPVYRANHPPPTYGSEAADAVLLQQVDAQLARSIPGSMEPLVALAWSSEETHSRDENSQGKQE
ncbi:MAG TPA: hypothetical protein VNH18_08710 [Bryobacteraceae bacterium]|nr:hypothetical protein [Bryobacteraceae bacterium]